MSTGMPTNPYGSESNPSAPMQGSGQNIPNYLVHSILVTLCCCLPLGIVAIVYAAQVNSKLAAGDLAGAQQSSDNAKKWCIIGLVAGVIANLIVIVVQVMLGVAAQQGAAGM
jgi:hypothetical protein